MLTFPQTPRCAFRFGPVLGFAAKGEWHWDKQQPPCVPRFTVGPPGRAGETNDALFRLFARFLCGLVALWASRSCRHMKRTRLIRMAFVSHALVLVWKGPMGSPGK